MIKIRNILIFFFLLTLLKSEAQNSTGLIPIQTFDTKDYNTQPQNWAIAEDKRGVVYIGNKEALLVYTGSWKKFIIDNHNDVWSIDVDANGKVFVGGSGEFGYFYLDSNLTGKLIYYPIYQQLEAEEKAKIQKVSYTVAQDSTAYFSTEEFIYWYRNKDVEIINPPGKIVFLKKLHHRVFVGIEERGLYEIIGNQFIEIGISGQFTINRDGKTKLNIRDIAEFGNSNIVYINRDTLLETFDLASSKKYIKAFKTQLDDAVRGENIVKILNLKNKYFALYSKGKGVYIIDHQGRFIRKLDIKTGLQDDVVEDLFLDSQNNLWLAHSKGISRVSVFSNYQSFPPDVLGFKGRIQAITRFNDKLYFGTGDMHLYYLHEFDFSKKSKLTKEEVAQISYSKSSAAELKESLNNGSWGILNITIEGEKSMLFITNDNVFQLKENGEVDTAFHHSGTIMVQDPMDSNRIWIGLYPEGLASFYFENGKWIDEGMIPKTECSIVSLAFDQAQNLWLGRTDALSVLYKPVFKDHEIILPKVDNFGTKNSLPDNDAIYPMFDGNKMIFASSEGLFLYDNKTDKFAKTNIFTDWYTNHFVFRMMKDSQKNIWTVTYPLVHEKIFIKKLIPITGGNYMVSTPYAQEVTAHSFDVMYQDGNSLWAGGDFDLVKINSISENDTLVQIKSFINQILINNKDTLFDGFFFNDKGDIVDNQSSDEIPIINYQNHNLTFQFSAIAQKLEGTAKYRWILEGNDENWEDWTPKTEVRFTNLHEGKYVFRLQAKDIYDNISKEVSYSFTIRPPWHRTVWAYISYFILFIAFVWGAINVSTQSLKKIIRQATTEIREQKDDIEEKNQNIVSSIRYAQRIQEAVSPQKKLMDKVFPEHFVLWKPRDIVSGDFYWMMQKGNKAIIAAADCTGHGVPGAFMSIMGISFLNEIANSKEVQTAAEALNQLRFNVINSLNQEGAEMDTKDGMDMSICVYDFDTNMMQFAGAYNPLYMIRDGELSVIKADRMPIGVHERDDKSFTNMEFSMHKGDVYYILSDGYIDQFGGPNGKKFMTKNFKELILEIHTESMEVQKEILWQRFTDWRGEIEQIDDVIIIGIKV